MKKFEALLLIGLLGCGSFVFGQTEQTQPFRAGLNLGTDVLLTGKDPLTGLYDQPQSWTQLGFQPDVALGKFGVGLNLTLHFQIYPADQPDQAVALYPGDWVPDYHGSGQSFFDLYLPKVLYVRYGLKGVDPFFVKVGAIGDFTLGNGFIMGNYSNMNFFPQRRISGLDLGVDGTLFNFPYVGFEFLTGNLAQFDVIGFHVLGRPLVNSDNALLKGLQIGASFATDTNPGLYTDSSLDAVSVFGFDALLPVYNAPMATMAVFTETAFEPSRMGTMFGVGGKLVKFLDYGLQLRYLGAGFIPNYFDANYDIYRAGKAYLMSTDPTGSGFAGWYASIGTSILGNLFVTSASLDGPFASGVVGELGTWPHFRAVAVLGEGLLPGVYADAIYEKYYLGSSDKGFFGDLVDPTNAIARLGINYKTGSSILTLMYNAKWMDAEWQVTSSLQASVKF